MRLVIALLMFFIAISVSAQHLPAPAWARFSARNQLAIQGYAGGASAQLTNAFVGSMLTDEVLDTNARNVQMGRLRTTNIGGGDYRSAISGVMAIGQGPWSMIVAVSDHATFGFKISEDALRLAFLGNKSYAGEAADISGLRVRSMRYQRYGIGCSWAPTEDVQIAVLLSFVNGEQWLDVSAERALLRTSLLGDTLGLDVRGSVALSDTSQRGFAAHNGGGMAADVSGLKRFYSENSAWDLRAAVYDVGWVQWHPEASLYVADTQLTYTGIEVLDVANLNQITGESLAAPYEDALQGATRTQTRDVILPGWALIELQQTVAKGLEVGGGAVWRWASDARTFAWMEGRYRFNERFATGAEVGYGGFGAVQVALSAAYASDRIGCNVRVGNVEAWMFRNALAGGAVSVSIQFRL